MRDRPVPPADAAILARDKAGEPALFGKRENCLGFAGHPEIKAGMHEYLIRAFNPMPRESVIAPGQPCALQSAVSPGDIMVGIMKATGLMDAVVKFE